MSGGNLVFGTSTATAAAAYRSEATTALKTYTFSLDIVNRSAVSNFQIELYRNTSNTLTGATLLTTFTSSDLINGKTIRYTYEVPSGSTHFFYKLVKTSTENATVQLDNLKFRRNNAFYKAVQVMKADYYPFGQTIEERTDGNGDYRYGYTGKEQDTELKGDGNSYNFGDRQYDPRIARWTSLDPMKRMYPTMSPYCYAGNTPIAAYDPDGNWIIFVNGYVYGDKRGTGDDISSGRFYWYKPSEIVANDDGTYNNSGFLDAAKEYFDDDQFLFVNGSGEGIDSRAGTRYLQGFSFASSMVEEYRGMLEVLGENERIEFVTHSMGAAYAEGMIAYFKEYAPDVYNRIDKVVHFSAADAEDIAIHNRTYNIERLQLTTEMDLTLDQADFWTYPCNRKIPDVDVFGFMYWDVWKYHSTFERLRQKAIEEGRDVKPYDAHADTKFDARAFEWLRDMESLASQINDRTNGGFHSFGATRNEFLKIETKEKVATKYDSSGSNVRRYYTQDK